MMLNSKIWCAFRISLPKSQLQLWARGKISNASVCLGSQIDVRSVSVRIARVSVSAAATQLHQSAPATGTMYDLLGVREQAGLEEIKAAYRKQARQWHPDVCVSTDDKSLFTQRFVMVREAYEVLSDPKLRRGYDSVLLRGGSCSCQDRCRRLRDWEAQLQGLQSRSVRDSWGSRMRRGQHYGQSN